MPDLIDIDRLERYDKNLKGILKVWSKKTDYSVNDIVEYKGNYLKCTTAGKSGTTTLDFTNVSIGDTITDGTVVWEIIEPPTGVEYSTEERKVGTWIDGKPLYQRTLTGTIAVKDIVIDISGFGIDTVYDVSGIMGDAVMMIPLNYYNNGAYTYGLAGYGSSISDKKIYIGFSTGLISGNYYVTIKYTKV